MALNSIRAVLLIAGATLAGCSALPRMKLAPELSGLEPWVVQGQHGGGQAPEFGRWQVTTPANFLTQSSSIGGGDPLALPAGAEITVATSTRLIEDRTTYGFGLVSQADKALSWSADCSAYFRLASRTVESRGDTDETQLTQPGYPHLDCTFAGSQAGRLTLRTDFTTQRDAGTSEFSGQTWQVRSVNVLENGNFPWARFGYEVVRGEHVVAAVERIGDGRVWMRPDLSPPEEDELAVVMTALLYYGSLIDLHDD